MTALLLLLMACPGPGDTGPVDSAAPETGDTGPPPEPFYGLAFTRLDEPLGPGNRDTWSQALTDIDGDGNLDVFAGNHAGFPQLWIGDGAGGFELSTSSLLTAPALDDHGLLVVDLDGDGDRDAFMHTGRGVTDDVANRLWLNDGGVLTPADAGALAQPGARGRSPFALDFDGNGRLDVFNRNEPRPDGLQPSTLFQNTAGGFVAQAQDLSAITLGFDALVDADQDGELDWVRWSSTPEVLDVATLQPKGDGSLDMPRVFGVLGFDADGDAKGELLLVRGYGLLVPELRQPATDELWAGFGVDSTVRGFDMKGGNQLLVEAWSSRVDPSFAIGASNPVLGDLPQLALIRNNVPEGIPQPDDQALIWIGRTGDTWHFRFRDPSIFIRAALHLTADEPLTDITPVGTPELTEEPLSVLMGFDGTTWEPMPGGPSPSAHCDEAAPGDFDNDGDVDVFFACAAPTRNLPDELWLNDGAGTFTLAAVGAEGRPDLGRTARGLVGDVDNDGALDIFVAAGQPDVPGGYAPYWLLHNQGNDHHWLIVDPRGSGANTDAIGARVELDAGGKTQVRWMTAGQQDGSQHDRRAHFGLGQTDTIDELRVFWPSGSVTTRTNVTVDEVIRVQQP